MDDPFDKVKVDDSGDGLGNGLEEVICFLLVLNRFSKVSPFLEEEWVCRQSISHEQDGPLLLVRGFNVDDHSV